MIWYDMIYDMIWYMIWYDMIRYKIWYGMVWYGMVWYGIWYDMIWYGMVWYGIWWYDMIWYDTIRYDIPKLFCSLYSGLFSRMRGLWIEDNQPRNTAYFTVHKSTVIRNITNKVHRDCSSQLYLLSSNTFRSTWAASHNALEMLVYIPRLKTT